MEFIKENALLQSNTIIYFIWFILGDKVHTEDFIAQKLTVCFIYTKITNNDVAKNMISHFLGYRHLLYLSLLDNHNN